MDVAVMPRPRMRDRQRFVADMNGPARPWHFYGLAVLLTAAAGMLVLVLHGVFGVDAAEGATTSSSSQPCSSTTTSTTCSSRSSATCWAPATGCWRVARGAVTDELHEERVDGVAVLDEPRVVEARATAGPLTPAVVQTAALVGVSMMAGRDRRRGGAAAQAAPPRAPPAAGARAGAREPLVPRRRARARRAQVAARSCADPQRRFTLSQSRETTSLRSTTRRRGDPAPQRTRSEPRRPAALASRTLMRSLPAPPATSSVPRVSVMPIGTRRAREAVVAAAAVDLVVAVVAVERVVAGVALQDVPPGPPLSVSAPAPPHRRSSPG